jgi:hypothetical protein
MSERKPVVPPYGSRAHKSAGRRCCLCGKQGGTAMTLVVRALRERGVPLKNDGAYVHSDCAARARKEHGL